MSGPPLPFDRDAMERALTAWLPSQRWYAGKTRPLDHVSVVAAHPFGGPPGPSRGPARGLVLVARAHFADAGAPEHYQVPIGIRPALPGPRPEDPPPIAVLGDTVVHEALADHALVRDLLALLAQDTTRAPLAFRAESTTPGHEIPGHRPPARPAATSRLLTAEQSNTSVVIDDRYLLKCFRRLHTGTNPEVELRRALAGRPGPPLTPPLHAVLDGHLGGAPVTYAVLQSYLPDAVDGWTAALHHLETRPGQSFAQHAHAMGTATGAVHTRLAAAFGTRRPGPGETAGLTGRLVTALEDALRAVPELARHETALRHAYAQAAALTPATTLQRVHGDLHLGQLVRSGPTWQLIDFEGEPATPMAERTSPRPPLSDVAGMLRSFDYAAHHAAWQPGPADPADLRRWARDSQDAFCDGYALATGSDPRHHPELLRAHTLAKAVYESAYEARNRPHWLHIPLEDVERLLDPAAWPPHRPPGDDAPWN
ncbi:maltokinase [Kitasatospora sp. NPDC057223]|uniref:maltokinase N-terminal cap-like domain-containing protein n=1 Tax=Kitasatospora sp. NPDC057223 TaxID=3346055 RepID=UPI0036267341